MIDAATRSTTDLVSDTAPTTHLLGLDTSSPLPAWMLLNAVRHQRFSGELTLHTMPAVRVWAIDGLVYWAERAGALTVGDRLVELGVVDQRQAAAGTLHLGDAAFIGQLFARVPNLNRDEIMNALSYVRDTIIAEVAELHAARVDVVAERHHASGIVLWFEGHDTPLPAAANYPPHRSATPVVSDQQARVSNQPTQVGEHDEVLPEDVAAAVRQALAGIRASLAERSGGASSSSGTFTFTYLDHTPTTATVATAATVATTATVAAAATAVATPSEAAVPKSTDSPKAKRRRLFGRGS